jgi:hypothetical protein
MFAVNMLLSLIVMYFVMFSMIDGWGDFRNNLNMFYMALTMVAPMGIIMLATMQGMYRSKEARATRPREAQCQRVWRLPFIAPLIPRVTAAPCPRRWQRPPRRSS